jgi:hypothetical protein
MEIPYLLPVVQRVQNLEETQELRINDGMPDIGCVLGAWGQVLLRGKEWNAGRVGVSGGVMVWALYQPEDGGEVQCVESWVPFQAKWDFTDTGKEGKLRASCLLNGIDVRSISARKLMLRVGIGISCDAGVPEKICVPVPEEQEDIYLLQKEYPLQIPVETGEKMFTVNEEITVPGNLPGITKLLRYELRPELTDQKVLGNKAVFRGAVILHILYLGDDGQLHSWECDLPFSQYTELDGDFSESAQASFWIAVTNLELEIGESRILRLQGGLTAQYTIFERKIVAVAEDAYSTEMKTCLKQQTIQIPTVLDMLRKTLESDAQQTDLGIGVADVAWYPDYPEIRQEQYHVVLELS